MAVSVEESLRIVLYDDANIVAAYYEDAGEGLVIGFEVEPEHQAFRVSIDLAAAMADAITKLIAECKSRVSPPAGPRD